MNWPRRQGLAICYQHWVEGSPTDVHLIIDYQHYVEGSVAGACIFAIALHEQHRPEIKTLPGLIITVHQLIVNKQNTSLLEYMKLQIFFSGDLLTNDHYSADRRMIFPLDTHYKSLSRNPGCSPELY
jgi:hypothetical protein